jgi:hypothetical protein
MDTQPDLAKQPAADDIQETTEQTYTYSEKRKLGIMGTTLIIVNKIIGTGSMFC